MSRSPSPHTEQPDPTPSSATPSYDPVGIFWDYENCAPSTNASGYNIVDNIRTLASQFGSVNLFKAYLQLPDRSSSRQSTLRSELQSCGVSLTDCPHNGKNSVDLMMIVDIMAFIKDNPPPATVILISGDRDFAYLLSTVRWRKYNVVLISNFFMTHESLTVQASVVYDWKSDILKTRPAPKPQSLGSQILSPIASLTTPQDFNNLPESDSHPVGLSVVRVSPAVQPLTLSPRPASAAAISATPPGCATIPPETPSVKSEATPILPRARIPPETRPASISTNPTSDDWIEAESTGGSTTVHPSNVRGIAVDPVAQQDPLSPKATGPIDDGDTYSPAFSSPEITVLKGEGGIPSPGGLILIDEESSIEPIIHNHGDPDLSGATKPILKSCECQVRARSPVLLVSQSPAQGIVGLNRVESTPCEPPTSLPKAVPPPELPVTHEIPSRTLTPTLTPKTLHPPWTDTAKPPSEPDESRGFEDLIAVLNELSANGGSAPRFSTVFSLWKGRKPDAFEAVSPDNFKAHLQLAESAGIVAVNQHQDGYWWVTLRQQRDTDSDGPIQPQHSESPFHNLVQILNELRLAGDPEPQFFIVGPRLLGKNPSIYKDAGVTTFEEYVRAAAEAGVITVRGMKNGDGSLMLCPAYCSPPVPSQTAVGTTSPPSKRAASAVSPFAPLVDFLKSKQLVGGRPIPFSEVYSHLISTYPDPAPLCTGVPGATTVDQYINAAVASGLVSQVEEKTASGNALVSFRVGLPDRPSPLAQPSVSTTPLPSIHPSKRIAVPSRSVYTTPNSFRDLVAVLTELQTSTGESTFRFSRVIPPFLKRKPDAYLSVGVARFMDYVTLAMESGVVRAGEMDQGDGWVSLNNPSSSGPTTSLRSSKSSGGVAATALPPPVSLKGGGVDPKFVDLVETMGKMWEKGDKQPLLSLVGSELLAVDGRRARTLNACGVNSFGAYAQLARDVGIVEIHGRFGKQTMSLNPTIRAKAGYT